MTIDIGRLTDFTSTGIVGRSVRHIIYIETVDSTMSVAKSLIDADEFSAADLSGTLVVAEEQSAGRGRSGRSWDTPYGVALLTSTILAAPHLPSTPTLLPMVAALAAARAIERSLAAVTGPTINSAVNTPVMIKWPNDLLLASGEDGEMGKVAGVLIETGLKGSELTSAAIGIGINANQTRSQLPSPLLGAPNPTSIRLYSKKEIDRTDLLIYLCEELSTLLNTANERAQIYSAWRGRLHTLNQDIAVFERLEAKQNGTSLGDITPMLQGTAIDVTDDGDLVIKDEYGNRHYIAAGDVSVRQKKQ